LIDSREVALNTLKKARRVSVVASLLGCDKATVHRMIDDGRLAGFRIGRMKYVYMESVEQYQLDNDFVAHDIE
jgi:excisionase family DNA binding protein